MSVITAQDLNAELMRVAGELREANERLAVSAYKWAHAEHSYRKRKAEAFAQVRQSQVKLLAPEREALADSIAADARLERDLAEVAKMAATESVRSLRSMLSALQSVAASARSEADLAGRGGDY